MTYRLMIIPPIVAMLYRHKLMSMMVIVEVAILTAIIANAVAIVDGALHRMHMSTGVDENNLGVIRSISVVGASNNSNAVQNLALLRHSPYVVSAAYGATPLMNSATVEVRSHRDGDAAPTDAFLFQGSQDLSMTLGLNVIAGRDFGPDDPPLAETLMNNSVLPVLVTEALSRKLFPVEGALGKVLYSDDNPMRVIGIVRHLRAQLSGAPGDDLAIISELRIEKENVGGAFTIRARDGLIDKALPLAAAALERNNPGHVQAEIFTFASKRREYFSTDVAVIHLLMCVVIILLMVLAAGLAGLTHFSVQRRRRQIGIMRALGAAKKDIRFHFLFESLLLVASGAIFGVMLAFFINWHLVGRYGLVPIAFRMPALTAIAMLVISLATVASTTRQAMRMNPAELVS